MKNLYVFLFSLLVVNCAIGQNLQNSNWFFGQGVGLTFDGSTNIPTTSLLPNPLNTQGDYFHNKESHATLSDTNGNLLMFSDGRAIYQNWQGTNHKILQIIPLNNVYNNRTLFVPIPNHPNHYLFIIQKFDTNSTETGLQFVEFDLSNGLATIVGSITSLNDASNNVINGTYNLSSSSLTSTTDADGENYWVLSHVRNVSASKILCYKVTSNGISITPTTSFDVPDLYSSNLIISPDTSRISMATSNGLFLGNFNNSTGIITSMLSPLQGTSNFSYYDAAFSPNSNNLFYSAFSANGSQFLSSLEISSNEFITYGNEENSGVFSGMQLAIDGRIYIGSTDFNGFVIGNPNEIRNPGIFSFNTYPHFIENDFPQWVHQQNNSIDPCSTTITGIHANQNMTIEWDDVADSYIVEAVGDTNCAFGIPNDSGLETSIYGTVTITENHISVYDLSGLVERKIFRYRIKTSCGEWSDWCCVDINSGLRSFIFPNGSCFYGDQPCNSEYNLSLTLPVSSGTTIDEQASNHLTATNIISNGANADYHAGETVFLNTGFEARAGSVFLGHIEDCTNVQGKPAQQPTERYSREVSDENVVKNEGKKDYIIISPNPSSTLVSISLENLKMKSITVTSLDSRTMFTNNEGNIAIYKLDISNYIKGIYLVTVNTVEGKVVTGKIIKN